MQLISKKNKEIRFLLCVIDLFSKYESAFHLKDKKLLAVVDVFQSIIGISKSKPNKISVG